MQIAEAWRDNSRQEPSCWQFKISIARDFEFRFSFGVRNIRSFIWLWLPVIIWMSVIFTASTERGSMSQSSRILGPLLHWLLPNLSEDEKFRIIFGLRKMAHLTEYAILALLLWRARRGDKRAPGHPWTWTTATEALWIASFYASTDEFHQTFVPSREGCIRDVCIDTAGAAAGLAALWLLGRLFKRW
jgi:VanZ family protein